MTDMNINTGTLNTSAEDRIKSLEDQLADALADMSQAVVLQKDTEWRLRLLLEVVRNLSMGVVIMDEDFVVTSVNDAYCKISGLPESQIIGTRPPFETLMSSDPEMYQKIWSALLSEYKWEGELWGQRGEEKIAFNIAITAIVDANEKPSQYAAIVSDITQRKQDEERILRQANFDSLTGLPNRALFIDRLGQSLLTMSRARHKLGLMFIDLDGFKLVNDTLGHDKGDDLLREAAVRISSCTRNGDTVARLGGDEFTVIMPNLHDAKDAPLVAQRILDALAKPFDLDGTESFISGSIGITIFPGDASDANNLLKNADAAMYRAKDLGKANFQFFTSDLNEEVAERLTIKNGLIKALERDEFKVFYQPKVTLSTGQVDSVEALMRWDNPDLGMVSPARFIPVLEETGMVVEFGEWAIREACKQHRTWIDAGLPPIRIAVNLSARQLREISFVSVLQKVLHEAGVGPEGIEIEITESMIMSDTDSAIAALTELHGLGVRVAMDDFGTGYSSLSYLRKFPIDTIKIDGSFVADISTSADDAEIVRTIISMGQTLNKTIVAEGVETEEQLQLLRNFKCDQVQGYLFSRPVPGNELTEFIRETNR
jgi:diguanylate cyclase (GGDEF)-like protein/PAS domain S-box-containing protein